MSRLGLHYTILSALCLGTFLCGLMAPNVFAETEAQRKARLEKELENVERQILKQQVLVEDTRLERQSLERDLNLLDAQIKKAQLGIQARNLAIEQLGDQIEDKEGVIVILNERLARQRQSLGQLLRKTQEIDDYSMVEVLLSQEDLSGFFEDLESFTSIKQSLNESVDILKEIRADTEDQKSSLEDKQLSEAELRRLQEQEKKGIEVQEAEKEQILTVTKGQEAAYTELLEQQQKTAAQIRAQLFELSGGGAAIPFPEAVALAEFASAQTGVSAALVLAILEQESAYGSNIGNCAYDDIVQGKEVMHPDRDQPIFLAMADVLGFSARSQLVSCPWIRSGERIGWGGAMGPSQFIPSTWALYGGMVGSGSDWEYVKSNDVIRSLTGKSSASSPFNNQDAFMATALLMRDNGAAAGTYKAEWTAAIRYFAGWAGASNPINFPYGDNVMTRKERLEAEIKILKSI
ncbi:lytic murein transglycosylase [Candidatus Kaiserbacteria bacterium]|nr:lytic murein transglycosylase [Candidatus Kaiserbacteria bacterium]